MTIYECGLLLGSGGLVAMALLGLSDGASDGAGDVSDIGGNLGEASDADTSESASSESVSSGGFRWASFWSPRVWFSVALGFGAAGVVARKIVQEPWLLALALLCGVAFEAVVFRPTWNLIFCFASKPGRTLESLVLEEATVVTAFDPSGHGLVAVDLDGQIVQMLARLNAQSRAIKVRVGDKLFVESIDAARNSCVVSPIRTKAAS